MWEDLKTIQLEVENFFIESFLLFVGFLDLVFGKMGGMEGGGEVLIFKIYLFDF